MGYILTNLTTFAPAKIGIMKLLSYLKDGQEQLGVLVNGQVYDMEVLHPDLPNSMNLFLNYWDDFFPIAQAGELMLKEGTRSSSKSVSLASLQLYF